MISELDVIRQFTEKMNEAGIYIGDNSVIIADNQIHEFHVLGHKNRKKKNGRYRLWLQADCAVGFFWDWAGGVQKTWRFGKNLKAMPKKERDEIQRKTQEAIDEADRLKSEAHQKAKELATQIWNSASSSETHPYLASKGVTVKGVRVGEYPPDKVKDALLIPACDINGNMHSLQAIYYDNGQRKRKFLKDGALKGKLFPIGSFDTSDTIILAEGLSTGASIHMATGISVAVCFSVYQIYNVATALKTRYPTVNLIVACELDETTKTVSQISLDAGHACVRDCGALMACPPPTTKGTDFNDLHTSEGLKAVSDVIFAVMDIKERDAESSYRQTYDLLVTPIPLDAVNHAKSLPETDEKGRPLGTIENFKEILNRTGLRLLYNTMNHSCNVLMPSEKKPLYEIDRSNRQRIADEEQFFSWLNRFKYPKGDRREQFLAIAMEREYHPVKEWILSKPWDHEDRFNDFLQTLTFKSPEKEELYAIMLKRWMLSCVATIFHKAVQDRGLATDLVLVLLGGQGKGKTRWLRRLAPAYMGAVLDSVIMDTKNKDDVLKVIKHWIVELGELDATFKKSDIEAIKAFITSQSDVIRPPYGREAQTFPRRTVFCATVNVDQYLQDPTGNRRYLTLEIESINSSHNVDMQQLWAQILDGYRNGDRYWFEGTEYDELNANNEDHTAISPIQEMIDTAFDWDSSKRYNFLTATQVLQVCGIDVPRKFETNEAASYLRKIGVKPLMRCSIRGFLMPSSRLTSKTTIF